MLNTEEISEKIDFWALGVLAYEMYYSHTPFVADDDEQILY